VPAVPCVLAEFGLMRLINDALGDTGRVDIVANDATTALNIALNSEGIRAAPPEAILIVDAQIPQTNGLPPDRQEKAALWLLQQLRANGIAIPVLVITALPVATTELEEYCNPDNRAIALPLKHLNVPMLAGFIRMLRAAPSSPKQKWDVIEVEVMHNSAKCFIGCRGEAMIEWGVASSLNRLAQKLAYQYVKPNFRKGWSIRFHYDGNMLFNDLVISTLGRGLFSHLEMAAGGLEKLAFRFRVDDPALYSVPFEAAVRESRQPWLGNDEDLNEHPFVLVNAPIARRMKGGVTIRRGSGEEGMPRPARLLFIRSQVGENPAGETDIDTVEVEEIDQDAGRTRIRHMEFRRLENIDLELQDLQKLEACRPDFFSMEVLDLSQETDPDGTEAVLMKKLKSGRFDIVHFAGHSFTTKRSLTLLVLPSERPGEADGMAVQKFASGVAEAGARLVYLSSCQGSSANTVASLGQRGVPNVLAFRWDVEDEHAAKFAKLFYEDLFSTKEATISGAFRTACRGLYEPKQVEASRIWASPILASQSDNWMA
jgi:CHAT domain-containing protein